MTTLRAVIFDMDGVLVNSEPLHEKAQRIVFDRYQLTVPASFFSAFKGQTEEDVFNHVVATNPGRALNAAELVALKHSVYRDLMEDLQPIDGALPFLNRLAQAGYPLALTTSATRRDQQRTFELFSLHPFFNTVVTADDVTHPKPNPEPYVTTAQRLGVAPEHCLVIEDSTHGIRAARSAGCRVAGLATTFSTELLMQAGAHLAVEHFEALAQHLNLENP